jgi:tRNA G18 (ribose-2'-O)-methylase SpoU
MGAALRMPFARMQDWPADLTALKAHGIRLVALTPRAEALAVGDAGPLSRMALLVGHEGDGLSGDALGAADLRVRIPMSAAVDSLNVATAAAIALHALRPAEL